jgi:serine/threonine protein kinase
MSNTKPSQSGNKYILLDLIGVGGMAEVYRCKLSGQRGFEKIVVLKKLLPQVAQDTVVVENFIYEARLAALLQHENIVHIYDFGELDGSYFIAMEYLFGKDLYSIIHQAKETGKPIDLENSLLITSKICEGMHYAHDLKDLQQQPLNIIHRDLSPHNVFVTYDGKIKIIDFGIARAELFDNRTKAGVIKGKISYMSPEQLSDNQIDLRSDIFSIGILLYEMLSGQRMFKGDTASLIRQCMQADYEKLEQVRPDLFPGVYEIVDKALQKDRTKRYQTCSEMREAIEDCLFAMGKRPNTKILKEYVLQLFEHSFENEKKELSTTIERSGEVYHTGEPGTHWGGNSLPFSLPLSGKNEDQTAVVKIDGEGTLVLDPAKTAGNSSTSFFHKILSPSANSARKMILVGFTFCITVIFVFINLSSTKIEHNVEGGEKSESAVLQQSKTDEEEDLNVSQQLHQVPVIEQDPVIEQEQEIKISPQQYEINVLLSLADNALKDYRFTVPKDGSAFTYFKKVLEIAPDNNVALDGLRQISEKYAEYAEKELSEKKVVEAEENIQKGLKVYPQSGRLSGLHTRAEREKRILIEELERKARRSIENDELTSPAKDCAYKYYQDIRKLDHDSIIVKNGMRKIADRYAELADTYYRNFNLANAREYVKKGLMVQPDHDRLLGIQQDLSLSAPGMFFKMLEKNVQTVIK